MGNYPPNINARDATDTAFFRVDGGFTDWTRRLLISGLGSKQCIVCFGGRNSES